MYITRHAVEAARDDGFKWSENRLRDETLTAMIYGKRKDNNFIFNGLTFAFNQRLDVLKTVYRVK